MLPLGAKERFSRAGDGCSSGDLELIKASSNSYTFKLFSSHLNCFHIFSYLLGDGAVETSQNFILTFMNRGGHCAAWEETSMGKTSNQQQVTEPFWDHFKPLDFARSEANLTTTALEA